MSKIHTPPKNNYKAKKEKKQVSFEISFDIFKFNIFKFKYKKETETYTNATNLKENNHWKDITTNLLVAVLSTIIIDSIKIYIGIL